MRTSPQNPSQDPLFAGPGEIRALCRAIDWSATALGPAADWPRSLRLAVRMCLGARFPMTVWAGPELVLIYNERYPAVLGSDRHPWALGRPAREVWPELWDRLGPELEQVIQHGESTHHDDECFVLRREGEAEEAWFTYSFTPIQEEDGRVVGALNAFLETTERVRPLTERTALLHAISDSLPDRIFAKDLRGRVLFANPAMLAAVGRPAEQVLGKTDLEFLDDQDAARRLMENDRWVMESGSPSEVEEHLPLPDGTRRVWHSLKTPYRDDRGRIIGLLGISRDVTERTRAAEVLRDALEGAELERRRLMAVLDALPSGIAIADADGKLIQTNAALDRIWGSPPKSTGVKEYARWRGRWVDTGEPVAPGEWALARALASGEIVSSGRVEIEKCDGSGLATITNVAAPIRDGEGRTVGGVVVVVDTTEQRRVEEAVRASEERFRTVLEHSRDGINMLDLKTGRYVFASPGQIALTGFTAEELNDFTEEEIYQRIHPEDRERSIRQQREVAAGHDVPDAAEYRWKVKSGEYRWFSDSRKLVRDAQGRPVSLVGVSRDITDRKRAEEQARENEARYRRLFESIDEGFCIIQVQFEGDRPIAGRFLEVNPAFENTGIKNAVGRRIRDVAPEFAAQWCPALAQVALTGESSRFQSRAQAPGRFYDVYAFRIGAAQQRQVAVLFSDVTERKQTEDALRDADRRKDEFLAVLSHELRNPLAPIRNSVYLLERAAPGGAQAKRAMHVIERQTQLLSRLIEDLLDVTRISRGKVSLQRERVDLNALALGTAEDHREAFSSNGIDLQIEEAGEPIYVSGDPARLAQVIGNLLSNAAKFTLRGGKTVLAVEANARGEAVVRVRDDGAGMSPETLEHLFEPFMQAAQTLERTRGGLGLGLALVKGLVEMHGGKVTARSEGEGRGSELSFTLPLLSAVGIRPAVVPAPKRRARARRVLVVEDNTDAAETLRDILDLGGNEVAIAHSGPEGLELAHRFKPDVVLSDIGLPGMDGYGVARALRADPELRAAFLVALSGYAQPEDLRKSKEAGFDRHLSKPASLDALNKMIAEAPVLGGNPKPAGEGAPGR